MIARPARLAPVVVLAACLWAAGIAAGCKRQSHGAAGVSLQWTYSPHPPIIGWTTVSLALTDSTTGQPITDAAVRLEGGMTHPGMKPTFGVAQEVVPGRYESRLEFTMAGDWFVLFDVMLSDGRKFQRRVDVPGVGSQ